MLIDNIYVYEVNNLEVTRRSWVRAPLGAITKQSYSKHSNLFNIMTAVFFITSHRSVGRAWIVVINKIPDVAGSNPAVTILLLWTFDYARRT